MILSYFRTVVLYLVLILVIRLMGKRQIGQLEPSEFVVTMLVADLASIPMQDGGIPLFSGLMPILVVLTLFIAVYAMFMPGAMQGVVYYLNPDFSHFSHHIRIRRQATA